MSDTPGGAPKTPDAASENSVPIEAEVNNGTNGAGPATAEAPLTLEMQLAGAQAKAAEYLDGWQRARADFANYRKRAEKEREDAFDRAAVETLKKLLPIADDFERAVATIPPDQGENDLIKGFTLIHRKMVTLLESAGIKAIDPKGQPFDPMYHEALGHDETSEVASGHVSAVLQKGYLYGDRVLRPALVRVAS